MTVLHPPVTLEDLLKLPKDGKRHELVRGELRTMAPSSSNHGAKVVNLTVPLAQYVKQKDLGVVFGAETGFTIARNPDTVRAPDVAFVSKARIPPTGLPDKFFPGAADLAVEIVSPSDTVFDVDEKVQDWLSAGTRVVWVANPRRRTVTVYVAGEAERVFTESEDLDGRDVLPGFRLAVREIFA